MWKTPEIWQENSQNYLKKVLQLEVKRAYPVVSN